MYLIVGLGNPGKDYENTRHNVGFMTVDVLAKEYGFGVFKEKFDGLVAEGNIAGEKVFLLKPLTFMNLSGNSVVKAANFYKILPDVLTKLGAEVISLGVEPDGCNINRDCGSQHIEAMLEKVKEVGADIGIAVDGDGDRIKICDGTGELIKSEHLMAFLAMDAEESGENKGRAFASTKLSNTALERFITEKLNLQYCSTGVGERYVINALKENGGMIGGEESGHIVLLDYAKSGDAMMTSIRLLKGMVRQGKKPAQIFPLFKDDFLFYKNYVLSERELVKKITANSELVELAENLNKKIAGHGRVVIHPSGTEPKIRVWVCGDDEAMVHDFGAQLWNRIEKLSKIA